MVGTGTADTNRVTWEGTEGTREHLNIGILLPPRTATATSRRRVMKEAAHQAVTTTSHIVDGTDKLAW